MKPTETTQLHSLRSELIRQIRRMPRDEGLAVARTFYAELFSRHPDLRKHFSGLDVDTQVAKLWNVLRLVVARDTSTDGLNDVATRIARRHERRGIEPSHYALFTEVLVDVLANSQRTLPPGEAREFWLRELEPITALIMARHD